MTATIPKGQAVHDCHNPEGMVQQSPGREPWENGRAGNSPERAAQRTRDESTKHFHASPGAPPGRVGGCSENSGKGDNLRGRNRYRGRNRSPYRPSQSGIADRYSDPDSDPDSNDRRRRQRELSMRPRVRPWARGCLLRKAGSSGRKLGYTGASLDRSGPTFPL